MKTSLRSRLKKFGFTLVELVVSLAILSIMLLSLAQAIGYVSQLWISGVGSADNFAKARDIMSVMDRDIQQMVLRSDLPAFVVNPTANPLQACSFYTNVEGNQGTTTPDGRTISLVEYYPNYNGGIFTLSRLNYGNNFSTTQNPSVGATTLTDLSQATSPLPSTDTIATGVVQFGYQFVDGTGTIQTPGPINYVKTSTYPIAAPATLYTYSYNFTAPGASSNPRAIIVSLLVLSNSAYQLALQNPLIATKLTTDFGGILPANTTYSQYWNKILNPSAGTLDPTLPLPVRAGLRVFQRYIPLPVVTPGA
jgi:prepilin-type N-terminal cleavage/methylation domain-containing protein